MIHAYWIPAKREWVEKKQENQSKIKIKTFSLTVLLGYVQIFKMIGITQPVQSIRNVYEHWRSPDHSKSKEKKTRTKYRKSQQYNEHHGIG